MNTIEQDIYELVYNECVIDDSTLSRMSEYILTLLNDEDEKMIDMKQSLLTTMCQSRLSRYINDFIWELDIIYEPIKSQMYLPILLQHFRPVLCIDTFYHQCVHHANKWALLYLFDMDSVPKKTSLNRLLD